MAWKETAAMLPPTITSPSAQTIYNEAITVRLLQELFFPPSIYLVACSRRACSYVGWVQYFGTHYRIQANMGGLLHVDSFLNENYFASAKIDWTTFQINLSFYSSLFDLFGKAGGFTNRSSIDVSEEFLENSSNYIFYYGGDSSLANNNTAVQWQASLAANPYAINTTFADLASALPSTMTQQATTLRAVITSYLANGALPPASANFDYVRFYDDATTAVIADTPHPTYDAYFN